MAGSQATDVPGDDVPLEWEVDDGDSQYECQDRSLLTNLRLEFKMYSTIRSSV